MTCTQRYSEMHRSQIRPNASLPVPARARPGPRRGRRGKSLTRGVRGPARGGCPPALRSSVPGRDGNTRTFVPAMCWQVAAVPGSRRIRGVAWRCCLRLSGIKRARPRAGPRTARRRRIERNPDVAGAGVPGGPGPCAAEMKVLSRWRHVTTCNSGFRRGYNRLSRQRFPSLSG